MFEHKLHYKMYKAGRDWVFAAIATASLVAGFMAAPKTHVHADNVNQPAVTAKADQKTAAADTTVADSANKGTNTDSAAKDQSQADSSKTGADTNAKDSQTANDKSQNAGTNAAKADANKQADNQAANSKQTDQQPAKQTTNNTSSQANQQAANKQDNQSANKQTSQKPAASKTVSVIKPSVTSNKADVITYQKNKKAGLIPNAKTGIKDQNTQQPAQKPAAKPAKKKNLSNLPANATFKRDKKGNWYLVDKKSGKRLKGFQRVGKNGTYYMDNKTGRRAVGLKKITEIWYFFDKNGRMHTGWLHQKKTRRVKRHGRYRKVTRHYTYYFNHEGHKVFGPHTVGKYRYYFNRKTGALHKGFLTGRNKKRYYYAKHGRKAYGQRKIRRYWYNFGTNGAMLKSKLTYLPKQHKLVYYNKKGHLLRGRHVLGRKHYRFNKKTGAIQLRGSHKLLKHWYYFNRKHQPLVGMRKAGKKTYYYNAQAQRTNGLVQYRKNWYYFSKKNNAMMKGKVKLGGFTYQFDNKGRLKTGLQKLNNQTYFVDPASGQIAKGMTYQDPKSKTWYYFNKQNGQGVNTLQQQFKEGVKLANPNYSVGNQAKSFDGKSFENVDGYLTADTWYVPNKLLQSNGNWKDNTANAYRPLLMVWWPNKTVEANYLNYMASKGVIPGSVKYTANTDTKTMNNGAISAQKAIEARISNAKGDTKAIRNLMSDFVKSQSMWNQNSEIVDHAGLQIQGGFMRYKNSDLTPWANSNYRLLGRTAWLPNGGGEEFLLANDVDNSNPVVQAEQLNWLHYLMNFGQITANDPDANFSGIRVDAVDNVDTDLLNISGQYLEDVYGLKNNDRTANQHISILEDWSPQDMEYMRKIGTPELSMDFQVTSGGLRPDLGQIDPNADSSSLPSMQGIIDKGAINRANDDAQYHKENFVYPNYSFVRAHDNFSQDQIKQAISDAGFDSNNFTWDQMQVGLQKYYNDQASKTKKYNLYNIPSQYALLLTNKDTVPRVYYGDLYKDGAQYMSDPSIYYDAIANLMKSRIKYVSGDQKMETHQVNGHNILTSVRLGTSRTSGIGLVVSNDKNLALGKQTVVLHMGKQHANQQFRAVALANANADSGNAGLVNYTSDDAAIKAGAVKTTDANGDLVFNSKDIQGYWSPMVLGYLGVWVPVGAADNQDVRQLEGSTEANTDGQVFHSNAALDSQLIFEGFSNFNPYPDKPENRANRVIARKANDGSLKQLGITVFELAPQYMSSKDRTFLDSTIDNGYAFTDRYDLGLSGATKYGDAQDLRNVLKALSANGLQRIADWVPDQIYNLGGKEAVTVDRTNDTGALLNDKAASNILYVADSIGGGKYQAQYGGAFLEELHAKYPDLFTTKEPSTGQTLPWDTRITEWSAKYLNGTNILNRGTGYVLSDSITGQYYKLPNAVNNKYSLPTQVLGQMIDGGFVTNDQGKVEYLSAGEPVMNSLQTDAKGNIYYFDNSGNMVNSGFYTVDLPTSGSNGRYFFKPNGTAAKSEFVQDASGKRYYFDKHGKMITNKTIKVRGVKYKINKAGVVVKATRYARV